MLRRQLLAGQHPEEVVFDTVTTGASNDITDSQQAHLIEKAMITGKVWYE